ncbi:hypothetical protein CC1G_12849 [Coprinopsis cinerea okayama7|uniref:Uncharacterized protein n=1 Tax=Coprinopsis cinerea (strain Okayama-7 / 130 / ATCC MYA-4618 / FGSC 9003) TaxID=240176 RepID=A8PB23_COPC7|nr:hypothetical protein CC1G_12849 [Coprinopsis cinerea okayama7\|eukprot:XP_001840092.1 hypothetical protein CC1G_12849 [Coprinopsis cinerea okayama7\
MVNDSFMTDNYHPAHDTAVYNARSEPNNVDPFSDPPNGKSTNTFNATGVASIDGTPFAPPSSGHLDALTTPRNPSIFPPSNAYDYDLSTRGPFQSPLRRVPGPVGAGEDGGSNQTTPTAANKGKTPKPHLPRRRPTTLLLSPHRRTSPGSAKSHASSTSRRARIYSNQGVGGLTSPSPTRSRVSPRRVTPRSPSTPRILKKTVSPNPKAISLGVLGRIPMGMVFKKLKPLKRGLKSVGKRSSKCETSGGGAGEAGGTDRDVDIDLELKPWDTDVDVEIADSAPLQGFALAQAQSMEKMRHSSSRLRDPDHDDLFDDDDGEEGEVPAEEPEPYSPMPISPLAPDMTSTNPNILSTTAALRDLGLVDARQGAPGAYVSMEDIDQFDDSRSHYHPTELGAVDEDSEMSQPTTPSASTCLSAPLSPTTNVSISPTVSISSSMRRAHSKGKALRVLGYEVYQAYNGKPYASGVRGIGDGGSGRSLRGVGGGDKPKRMGIPGIMDHGRMRKARRV